MFQPIKQGYDHYRLTLVVATLITVVCLSFVSDLRVDLSSRTLYSADSEAAKVYESVIEEFGSDEIALVIAKDDQLFTPEKLERLKHLQSRLENVPYIQKVDSLFTLPDIRDQDGFLELSPILESIPKTQEAALSRKASAVDNPLLKGNVISGDGTLIALTLYLDPTVGSKEAYEGLDEIIEEEISNYDALYQLGSPSVNHWLLEALARDLKITLPAAGAILLLLLIFSLRSLTFGLIPLVNALIATIWTAALAVLLDIPLNLLNYIVPLLVLVVGATEDVHIIHEFRKHLNRGLAGSAAIKQVSLKASLALQLTALTTMLGFAATSASELPILQQFGIIAFAGVGLRFLISMVLLPAQLRLLERRAKRLSEQALLNDQFVGKISHWIVDRGAPNIRAIVLGAIAFGIVAICYTSQIESSNDQNAFLDDDDSFQKLVDATHEDLDGSTVFHIRIQANKNAFLQPEQLNQLQAITDYLCSLEGVDSARSFADSIRRIYHQLNEGEETFNRIPTDPRAIKQMLLFTRPGIFDAYVNSDYSSANIVVRSSLKDSQALNLLVQQIDDELVGERFGPINYQLTGEAVLVAAAVSSIIQAQVFSLGGMTLIVFCIISALFLSFRCGAISVITNFFSIAIVFGLMGFSGIPLNVGTCMVAAITLGIAIDDTIHVLIQFNRSLKESKSESKAIIAALSHEMNPIISTSLGLAGGFAILGFSNFEPVRQFGLLSACVILLALFVDLFLIPIFFAKTRLITLWDIVGLKVRRSLLEKSTFFRGLSPLQAKKIILASRIASYPANEKIIVEGEIGSTMYVVIDGELEATLERDGEVKKLAELQFGDVFGEVGMVSKVQRTANIQTKTDAKVLALDGDSLESMRRFSPYLASRVFLNIANILGERLAKSNQSQMKR